MDKSQLEYALKSEGASVRFSAGGKEYSAEPIISFTFDEKTGNGDFKVVGFELIYGENYKQAETFDDLFKPFEGKDLKLISINDTFESFEEYEEDKAFKNVTMEEILNEFAPLADSFSLTCPYNEYDGEHRYGVYGIDGKLSGKAIEEIEEVMKRSSERQFERIPQEVRSKLPPFEKLYEDIKTEGLAYRKKHLKKAEECDGNVFFCDMFARGKAKYKEPQELWHLYNSVDFVETCRFLLDKMRANEKVRPLDCELDEEEYKQLKSFLIKTEVSFSWHCTTSGMLSKTFYFELNGQTVNWLKKYKNDYDLGRLEDLAFYKDGEVLFSSCTHERFHTRRDKK